MIENENKTSKTRYVRLILVNAYFNRNKERNCNSSMTFVRTMKEFKQNLVTRFSSNTWLAAIDFSKYVF